MQIDIRDVVAKYEPYLDARRGLGGSPLQLGSSIVPRTARRVGEEAEWANRAPDPIREFWSLYDSLRLFEDVEYGQWGMVILDPCASMARTEQFKRDRSKFFEADDLVVAEFLGDSDLVVQARSGELLVATPLDPRDEWCRLGRSLSQLLAEFLEKQGHKFWEESN